MSKTYTAALIGCGRMGATIDDEVRDRPNSFLWLPYSHAAGYTGVDRTDLIAVSDVDMEKAETIGERYNASKRYADYREMIEKETPDIVSIATRPATHAEITVFAAEHGVKAIYCEKPLCCSMAEADAMADACGRYNVRFNYGTQLLVDVRNQCPGNFRFALVDVTRIHAKRLSHRTLQRCQ